MTTGSRSCCGCGSGGYWWCGGGATGGFLILRDSLLTLRGAGRGPCSSRLGDGRGSEGSMDGTDVSGRRRGLKVSREASSRPTQEREGKERGKKRCGRLQVYVKYWDSRVNAQIDTSSKNRWRRIPVNGEWSCTAPLLASTAHFVSMSVNKGRKCSPVGREPREASKVTITVMFLFCLLLCVVPFPASCFGGFQFSNMRNILH